MRTIRPETPVPEFIDPVFTKTSPKRSFSLNRKRAFWLVFAKTGSIISGTDAYSMLKNVLITCFSPTQIDNCFKLLDMPPMSDSHPLAQPSDIMALLPAHGNLLVNAINMRGM